MKLKVRLWYSEILDLADMKEFFKRVYLLNVFLKEKEE